MAHHREEQARLADEIRRQEDQLHGYQSPGGRGVRGGPGYSPQPLFGGQVRTDHVKTILPNPPGLPPTAGGGGLMPPPYLPPMPPPNMMGPVSRHGHHCLANKAAALSIY